MNHRHALYCAAVVVAALCVRAGDVFAQELHVDREAENLVRFVSKTTLDEFEGTTDRIDGYALLSETEPNIPSGATIGRLYFEVDLASIDTGIGLRNRHMRDNYLEVERFPYAVFDGAIVSVDTSSNQQFSVSGSGNMAIHGIAREIDVSCAVTPEGVRYRTRCGFQILLSDFDIAIPKVMFLKLANEIRIELDFVLKPASRD